MTLIDLIKANNPKLLKRKELIGKTPPLPLLLEKKYFNAIKQVVLDPFQKQINHLIEPTRMLKDEDYLVSLETYTQPVALDNKEVNAIVIEAMRSTTLFTLQAFYKTINETVGFKVPEVHADIQNMLNNFVKTNIKEIDILNTAQADGIYKKIAEIYYKHPKDMKEQILQVIREATDLSVGRAMTLATTSINRLYADYMQTIHEALGITSYRWVSRHDNKVRPSHRLADGHIYEYANPPAITGGFNAGKDWNCRCQAVPVIFILEDLIRDGIVKAIPRYSLKKITGDISIFSVEKYA